MPKVNKNPVLKHAAKEAHAYSTIWKILAHSLLVFLTRLIINNRTKAYAQARARA